MTEQTETQSIEPKPVKVGMKGGKSNAEINAELRTKAARQAAAARAALAKNAQQAQAELEKGELRAPQGSDDVMVRVTRRGSGKISMGVHIGGIGEAHYEQGDEFIIGKDIAEELRTGPNPQEPRDWIEIVG